MRDGTPALSRPKGKVLRITDLDPVSAEIVHTLVHARKATKAREEATTSS
jgi:hypothetical protein